MFWFFFYLLLLWLQFAFPLRRRRRALFIFFRSSLLFFLIQTPYLGRRIGLCFIYRRFAAVPFVFYSTPPPPSLPLTDPRLGLLRANGGGRSYRMYDERIIMCKKNHPIRSCVESWNSTDVLFQLSFSTSHKSGFIRSCRRTWIII